LQQELAEGVDDHDLDRVRRALKAGANPNGLDRMGQPVLANAVGNGSVILMRELLKAGADVNGGDLMNRDAEPPLSYPPLFVAAIRNDPVILRELLEAGADPNVRGGKDRQMTALGEAAGSNSAPACLLLLEYGADPNSWNVVPGESSRRTPLMIASSRGYEGPVMALLMYGADATLKDEQGQTALDLTDQFKNPIDRIRDILADPEGKLDLKHRTMPRRRVK